MVENWRGAIAFYGFPVLHYAISSGGARSDGKGLQDMVQVAHILSNCSGLVFWAGGSLFCYIFLRT